MNQGSSNVERKHAIYYEARLQVGKIEQKRFRADGAYLETFPRYDDMLAVHRRDVAHVTKQNVLQ